MPGGVAVFDYNGDGRPDIFFTNGANIATLKKDDPKYRNRLFRNDGNGIIHRRDRRRWSGRHRLRHGRRRRGLRQRRPSRPLRRRPASQHALPQQRRRNLHRRHREVGARRQPEPSRPRIRRLLGDHRRLGRREQRRPARPLRRQLHAVDVLRQAAVRDSAASPTTAARSSTRASRISSS